MAPGSWRQEGQKFKFRKFEASLHETLSKTIKTNNKAKRQPAKWEEIYQIRKFCLEYKNLYVG